MSGQAIDALCDYAGMIAAVVEDVAQALHEWAPPAGQQSIGEALHQLRLATAEFEEKITR